MKNYHLISMLFLCLFLVSCGSSKFSKSHFSELSDFTFLDGTYLNDADLKENSHQKQLGKLSNIFNLPSDTIDLVNLKFNGKNIVLTFQTNSGLQEKTYKGKFKGNYFEACVKKKIRPIPVLFFGWQIGKIRIGQNEDKDLLIQYWSSEFMWILLGTGGSTNDSEYRYKKIGNTTGPHN